MSDIVYPPIHPGEILLEEFLEPLGLSPHDLAEALHVEAGAIRDILAGTRPVTADAALRLARHFGTTPQMWMNLQAKYDLEVAQDMLAEEIERTVPVRSPQPGDGTGGQERLDTASLAAQC